MNRGKLKQGIQSVSNFITSINEVGFTVLPEHRKKLVTFSRSELGTLIIWDEEVSQYRDCIQLFVEAVNDKHHVLSENAIEEALQDAVLKSLNINEHFPNTSFNSRLNDSLQELEARLIATPTEWNVFLQVLGVKLKTSCFSFGNFRFLPSDKSTRAFLWQLGAEIIQNSSDTAEAKKTFKKHLRREIKRDLFEGVVAWIRVNALDDKAARSNAIEELGLTLDVLNLFTLVVHPRGMEVRAYLPGQAHYHATTLSIAYQKGVKYNAESGLRGPIDLFSLVHLNNNPVARRSLCKLSRILKQKGPDDFPKRLLASIRFAGRATVNRVREESFLQHAIAMESLLADKEGAGEITFKLAARCAHLIGKDKQERSDIFKEIKKLYKVRSKIVHRGSTDLSDIQLSQLQNYVRRVLFEILAKDTFDHILKEEQFLEWFDEKLFS